MLSVIKDAAEKLTEAKISYMCIGSTALFVQGVRLPEPEAAEISVQWDNFDAALALFGEGKREEFPGGSKFVYRKDGVTVHLVCFYNTVIITDPDRISVEVDGQAVWAKSVAYYRDALPETDPYQPAIAAYIKERQRMLSAANEKAWNQDSYQAWVKRYGPPEEAAPRIARDPLGRLKSLVPHLGDVQGKKVLNALGSHGSKAVALALLGADATVVDISEQNARYANELAAAAGASIRYVISDIMELPPEELTGDYDLVLMELGILHYFIDLAPLMDILAAALKPGGRLIIQDFHPISTKLITSKGKKHKVTGNYFSTDLEVSDVAYSKLLDDGSRLEQKVRLRKWTLGEIVTSVAQAGLFLRLLDEEPNTKIDDMGIPKTFTLIAEKL
ncbi:methyltransferase family protein [Tumebacillus sp. BK434]|uniref:class I SAM-dependent methyltransferase n=1 Tax=Tumebacillus sp. BK434 TaxID=2512169 RepID=UPI0010F12D2E|nr:class I SAM-dependent methyltransferase [Tumebacillus sp. BK434]TCP58038.1 methyltransferase family protein [Tumebacillus sp. BK434]